MSYPSAPEPGIQVVAMVVYLAGSPTAAYRFATHGFSTESTDNPANTYFDGRIINAPVYSRKVGCAYWGSRSSSSSIGETDTANNDGELDAIAISDLRGATVEYWRGVLGTPFSTWVQIAKGKLDRISVPDENTVRWHVFDRSAQLAITLQSTLYATGTDHTDTVVGLPRPICYGRPYSVPAVQASAAFLRYDINDGAFQSITRVRDSGIELSGPALSPNGWTYNTGPDYWGFTLTANPAGRIVADVEAATSGFGSPTALVVRLEKVIKHLVVTHGPLTGADLDLDAIVALETAAPYALGAWYDQPISIASALTDVMDSFGGWWYFDRLGRLSVGRLEVPEDPVLEFGQTEVIGPIGIEFDRAEGLSDHVLGGRNWYPYQDGEMAGGVSPDDRALLSALYRYRRSGDTPISSLYAEALNGGTKTGGMPSLLTEASDVDTQAGRAGLLYGQSRWFVTFGAAMSLGDLLSLDCGQVIRVTLPRYGMDAGTDMTIVGIEFGLASNIARITGWCGLGAPTVLLETEEPLLLEDGGALLLEE